MKEHFQTEEIIKFNIKDGSQFGYKPMTAGEENDYMGEYMVEKTVIGEDGKSRIIREQDITKLNKIKIFNLKEAPYEGWDKKTNEEKWSIARQLKPAIFNEIIININRIDRGDIDTKKN